MQEPAHAQEGGAAEDGAATNPPEEEEAAGVEAPKGRVPRKHMIGPLGATIGRSTACGVHVKCHLISREHCRVAFVPAEGEEPGRFVLLDCGSRRGTLLNARFAPPCGCVFLIPGLGYGRVGAFGGGLDLVAGPALRPHGHSSGCWAKSVCAPRGRSQNATIKLHAEMRVNDT